MQSSELSQSSGLRSFLSRVEDDQFAFAVASCKLPFAARLLWPSTSRASSLHSGIAPAHREFVGPWTYPHAFGIFRWALQGPDMVFLSESLHHIGEPSRDRPGCFRS